MQRILLALDGSDLGERALRYAARLARGASARLILVRATQARTLLMVDPADAQTGVISQAEHDLEASAARVRAMGLEADAHVYYDEPVPAILDAAKRHNAELIVMSTHGRSGLGRMLYGSVADDVLRHAEVPVLLVPANIDHAWPTDGPLTALVPLDGSDASEAALDSARMLATHLGARLHLLRVIEPPTYPLYGEGYAYIPVDEEAERADAALYLAEQTQKLAAQGVQAEAEIASGRPDEAIARAAGQHHADIVVMATHGRGGLTRLVLGSVATGTVRRAHLPLLLTRPAAIAAQASDPPAEATAPPALPMVTLTLSPDELILVRRALETSVADYRGEGEVGTTLRAILARLAATEAPAAPASSPDLVATR